MAEQRSRKYPNINVTEAVSRVEALKQKSGLQKRYNNTLFAQGIGYKDNKSGAFIRTVAALTQYGLIQKDGDGYSLSAVAQKILVPTDPNDRDQAIRDAAISPSLFASLYSDWKGKELPDLFPNILVTNYGILDGAKNKVTAIFRSSMDAVGLLDGNTLKDMSVSNTTIETPVVNNASVQLPAVMADTAGPIPDVPSTTLTKDFGEGRLITITIPNDLTDEERKKIVLLIENM